MSDESQQSGQRTEQNPGKSLGPALLPQLNHACEERLTEVRWFRTDWQRGGAATAYATLSGTNSHPGDRSVVVKFPIGPREYRVLVGLAATPAATPRVAYHGTELGSFDMAWVVMERLDGQPLKADPSKKNFLLCTEALGSFYENAEKCWPLREHETSTDWTSLIAKARESAKVNAIPDAQRWSNTIQRVQRILDRLLIKWHTRPVNAWCHGDLHLANVMLRSPDSPWRAPDTDDKREQAVIFDFANVRSGHWVEDAVYLERQYWANPEVSKNIKPLSMIAKARRSRGLEAENYTELAMVRRILLASCVPAFLEREGHPSYLAAALAMLEKQLELIKM